MVALPEVGADFSPEFLYIAVTRVKVVSADHRAEIERSKSLGPFTANRPMRLTSATDSFSAIGVRGVFGRSGTFAGDRLEARVRYSLVQRLLYAEWDGLILPKFRFLILAPKALASGTALYNSFNATVSF